MASRLLRVLRLWTRAAGIVDTDLLANPAMVSRLASAFDDQALREPADARRIATWERLHGFNLPVPLVAWLRLSDGFYLAESGPLIHPLSAIGPMIPFATVPGLYVQPESWFELGNPGAETVCIDLAYQRPGGGAPIFLSGDHALGTAPRIIAPSFEAWFLRVLREGGRPYWFDPGFAPMGDPWVEHRRHAPVPPLPDYLRPFADVARPLMHRGTDDRSVADRLGLTRGDVELLYRHLQHAGPG
jgi:hypothetical protein